MKLGTTSNVHEGTCHTASLINKITSIDTLWTSLAAAEKDWELKAMSTS
jgi:hypothetical protein